MSTRNLFVILALATFIACDDEGGPGGSGHVALLPEPGLPRYQELGAIDVPEGVVSPAGGNYLHRRVDFTIDTLLGTRSVGAAYNSADDAWRWSWELEYGLGGYTMVDPTGAVHELFTGPGFSDNRLFPGGHWVRVDDTRMRSVGGLVHEFHPNGKLAAIYWQSADYPRLAYRSALPGGAGPLVRVEQCTAALVCTLVYRIERDGQGRVRALEDRAGRRAEFDYDAEGRLVSARDPLDLAEGWPGRRYAWWGPRLVSITNSEDERIEIETRWANGQVTAIRRAGTTPRVHRFTYLPTQGARPLNEPSREMRHRDPEGHETTIHVDGHRRARRVRRPSGATSHYEYTGTSFELSAYVSADGTRTEWTFTGETQIDRTDPSGNVVAMQVRLDDGENRANPFARPIDRIDDTLGRVEERGYDTDGRLIWIENGEGERTSFTYDAGNQLASVTPPDGLTLGFSQYGEHGHAEQLSVGGETAQRSFDAVGNLLMETGFDRMDRRRGGEESREYDADRNLATLWLTDSDPQVTAPTAHAIDFTYRSDGRPVSVLRPHGGDHAFDYDDTGLPTARRERVDGAWQTTSFEHDRNGRVRAIVLPNGMRRERDYTPDGELAAIRALSGTTVEDSASFTWSQGRLDRIDDAAHTAPETIAYDPAGRRSAIVFPDGERLEFDYDARSRRTSETFRLPGGSVLRTLDRAYDDAGREVRVDDDGALLYERDYRDGRVDGIAYGNGLDASFAYDALTGAPSGRTLSGSQGVIAFSSVTQTVSPADTAVAVLATTASPLAASLESHHLGLDAGTGAAGKRLLRSGGDELGFDALGNLLRNEGTPLGYNAERNRLLSVAPIGQTPISYGYDAAGYVISRDGVALTWSAAGRIAAIGSDSFVHDALGRPLERTVTGVTRHFTFGGRVETSSAGVPQRLDLGSAMLELDTGATRYRHLDYRGNVDLVTDDQGDVVAHYEYDAYGVVAMTGTDDGARTFAGGRLVQGLIVLGPRLHDPLAARFLAPDPILQPANQFSYTSGNPVWWWDASGLHESTAASFASGSTKAAGGVTLILAGAAVGAVTTALGAPLVGGTVAAALVAVGSQLLVEGLAEQAAAEEEASSQPRSGSPQSSGDGGSGGGLPTRFSDPGGGGPGGLPGPGAGAGGSFGGANLGGHGAFGAL